MCENFLGKYTKKLHDKLYGVMRILVGLMFLQHGLQKLFGMFGGLGGSAAPLFSLMGVAGTIEFLVGLALVFGLLVRLAALGGALLMLAAYGMAHIPKGLVPLQNGGELAVMFFSAFLVILAHGAKIWSLEKALLKKEHEMF